MTAAAPLSALVVDDEPLARARLRAMLEEQGIVVSGEAENGITTLQAAEDLKPDLVFLDIEMPGLTGVQMASAMQGLDSAPLIIFVTGYSEYAASAFDYDALDYLVKPVAAERLARCLARARQRITDHIHRAHPTESMQPIQSPPSGDGHLRFLPVRADFAVRFLSLADVQYVCSKGKHTVARTSDGEFRTYYNLTQLESLLPPDRFLRIHDSSIVSLDHVQELLYLGDHNYEVRLTNQQRLRVARARYAQLLHSMGLR